MAPTEGQVLGGTRLQINFGLSGDSSSCFDILDGTSAELTPARIHCIFKLQSDPSQSYRTQVVEHDVASKTLH